MSGLVIAQIQINDSSDRTITGVLQFDRNCGGVLGMPSGTEFPDAPTFPGEIFWRSDINVLYRRTDDNTAWEPINTTTIYVPGEVAGSTLYFDGYHWVSLNPGPDGYFLQARGPGQAPEWVDHDALRKLVHLADIGGPYEGFATGSFREILPFGNPFPTNVIWWTSSDKNEKIVEKLIVYNKNKTVSSVTWVAYARNTNTILATVTDEISYSGVFETSRTRSILQV